jgi:hypothetical protein
VLGSMIQRELKLFLFISLLRTLHLTSHKSRIKNENLSVHFWTPPL